MLTLIKLGGSLITDKSRPKHFRQSVMQRIASELTTIRQCADNQIVLGHGSGSFGHVEAKKYDTIHGVKSSDEWFGFAKVAHVASELSQYVVSECIQANLPVIRFQPSASVTATNGIITDMNTTCLSTALAHGLIPLIHGDVAFDTQLGGTIISTETIFSYLIRILDVDQVVLLGEVDGVLNASGEVIPYITSQSLPDIENNLKGSSGVDVTGGMYQKVVDMLTLVQQFPQLNIIIANGTIPNLLVDIVCNDKQVGTRISCD